jgi:hypothetical protein
MKKIEKCEWTGLGKEAETCCNTQVEDYSYCEEHVWRVYQKGSHLRARKKDKRRAEAVWDLESEFNSIIEELTAEGRL